MIRHNPNLQIISECSEYSDGRFRITSRAKRETLRYSDAGFTLIEILVYIGVFSLIILIITSFIYWFSQANSKIKVMRETLDNSQRVLEIISSEIREAKSIYTPTSVFASHPGQLSLETTKYLPGGEKTTFLDFYLCDLRLCLKKESQDPIALTSEMVEINNLVFSQIVSGGTPSVQINLTANYKNPANRPEYQASVNLTSTASLRNY